MPRTERFLPDRRGIRMLSVGVAALGLVAIAGCTAAPSVAIVPFDERDDTQLYVGDCFAGQDVDALDLQPEGRIACTEPHNVEVVGLLDEFDGEPLPGEDEINDVFYPGCFDAITAGIAGPLDELPLIPSYTGDLAADDTIDGSVVCLLYTRNGDIVTDSAFVKNPHDIIGDYRLLNRLEVGECFTLKTQNNIGLPVECESGVLMFLGTVPSDGDDYPGVDDLRLQRNEKCAELIPDDDRIDRTTLSGTVPGDSDWLRGARDITCDVEIA